MRVVCVPVPFYFRARVRARARSRKRVKNIIPLFSGTGTYTGTKIEGHDTKKDCAYSNI